MERARFHTIWIAVIAIMMGMGGSGTGADQIYSISDFAVFSGSGLDTKDLHIGQNVSIYGLVGSNGNIETERDALLFSGLRAGGSLNPGGIAGQKTSIGQSGTMTEAIVNGAFNFNGSVYGNVHAGTGVLLGASADLYTVGGMGGSIYSGGNVTFNASGPVVQGNVYTNGTVSGPGVINGTVSSLPIGLLKTFSLVTMPSATVFSAGVTDVSSTGGANSNVVLVPGAYRDLNLGSNRTVTLSSGDYYFQSITSSINLDLMLDLSSGAPVNIYVTGNIDLGNNADVLVKTVGSGVFTDADLLGDHSSASLVYLETHGQFTLGANSAWYGTVYASADVAGAEKVELSIGQNATVWGALYSLDQIDLNAGAVINRVSAYNLMSLPEPGTTVLLGTGGLLLLGWMRRRKLAD